MKCKGCTGEIEYTPLAQVSAENFSHAGPALTHVPVPACQWFNETPAPEILAYLNVARFKSGERATPLPGLAGK